MRLPRLLPAASLALLVACDDPSAPRPLPGESPSAAISDGSHGGNPDFFWLPPLAPNSSGHPSWDVGGFNPKLLVQIDVCRLDKNPLDFPPGTPTAPNPDAATCIPGPVVAHFGSDEISLSLTEESYSVQWKTDGLDPSAFYRMFAYVGTRGPSGIVLGFLDLDPVDKGMKNLRTGEVVAFQEGRNLPIKFRIERGALCENRSACVETTVSNDNPDGDHTTVPLTTASGTIAGALFPDGWLPANGPQSVVVTIERVNTGINDLVNGTQQFPCHAGLPLQQFDGCFRFTTQPVLATFVDDGIQKQFAREVTVAGCFVLHESEPEDPRERYSQLWASGPDEETRPLPSTDAPASVLTNHDCDGALGFVGQEAGRFAVVNAALDRIGAGLARVFGVRSAYAVDLGLGGLTWQFSNVGPVVSARIETVGATELTVAAGGSAMPAVRVLGTTVHDGGPLGTGIPNVPVVFSVVPENGTLQAIDAPPTTGGLQSITVITSMPAEEEPGVAAGFAPVRWTLPSAPGTYTLTATAAATGGPVTFTATVPAVTINVVEPPELTNAVDGLVGSPSIVLRDASGAALPGVVVTFATVSGGSVLTDSVVTTNADGYASLGSWRLGPTPTMNIIEARAAGAAPTRLAVLGTWLRRLTVGALTACVIDRVGQVQCWGDNGRGQFGTSPGGFSTVPVAATLPPFVRFSPSIGHALCGFVASGSAMCWGRADFGMLTLPGGAVSSPPVAIAGGPYTEVGIARISACGLATTGIGYCWGSNQRGEIGSTSVPLTLGPPGNPTPTMIDGGLSWSSIVAGWLHACGLTKAGAAYCWGLRDLVGAGGTPVDTISRIPLLVSGGHSFKQLAIGPHHTCGLTTEGRAWCWGYNASGQLGDGSQTSTRVPVAVATQLRFSSISVGDAIVQGTGPGHTCALTDTGTAYCWGLNDRGQLGDGSTTDRHVPTAVAGGVRFTALELGEYTTCGMRGESVWCWGGNDRGQIGDGTTLDRPLPVLLGGQID